MYVLLGSNGNITSKTAQLLLSRGQRVRVVGRNAEKLEPLWLMGAELAIGEAIAQAVARAGVKRVINLSRAGAHLERGAGLIVSLSAQEQRLNRIAGVKTLHLRPSYFFDNYFTALKLFNAYGAYSDLVAPNLSIPPSQPLEEAKFVLKNCMSRREPSSSSFASSRRRGASGN